ncbi:MAG: S9 family peptidase [Dehalococcoidia bacterium]
MPSMSKRAIKPEDVYLLKQAGDVQVSPDGKRVAYTVSWSDKESDQGRMSVYVAPLKGGGAAQRFTQGKHDHSPRWSPDGRYLAFVSSRDEKNQIYLLPLEGGEPRQLTKTKFGAGQPVWSPDGKRIAYVARVGNYKEPKERKNAERAAPRLIRDLRYRLDGIGYFDDRRHHIFTVDVETGKERQITDGDWYDQQPAWSPDGRFIAFVSDRERDRFQRLWRTDLWVVRSTGGRARRLTRGRGAAYNPQFSPDGRSIAFVGHEHGEAGGAKNTHMLVLPVSGSRAPQSVSAPLDRSVIGGILVGAQTFSWSRDGRSLLFLAGDRGAQALYRAGAANGSVSKLIGGDRQIDSFALTPNGKGVVFSAAWTSEPPEVYSATLRGGRARNLSHANDELREGRDIAPVRRVTHKGPDGLKIESFVVYPPNYRRGRRYPLALQIHGGPHGVHPTGFQLTYQALASAGYVVLLPNPRGSTSYGEEFSQACVGDWGGKDFQDLMTGVDAMIRRRVADPNRLYVGGYSYGGFMTSWTVGQTDRFRAALIGAPVADHVSMFGTTDIPHFAVYEHEGSPFDNEKALRDRSPVTYLPNVKTPVLLVHWEGDLRCPIGQSEQIFQGLKMLGKKVEFVRYPGGSHGVRTPAQSVDEIQRRLDWYNRHAPRKAAVRSNGKGPLARAKAAVTSRNGARAAAKARVRAQGGNGRRTAATPTRRPGVAARR